ncbi:MAG: hypothetical protein KDA89_18515 [Planctomycetaceae bacterium]|nr:hypothetical protein [Planctomycetaceae bacterium]
MDDSGVILDRQAMLTEASLCWLGCPLTDLAIIPLPSWLSSLDSFEQDVSMESFPAGEDPRDSANLAESADGSGSSKPVPHSELVRFQSGPLTVEFDAAAGVLEAVDGTRFSDPDDRDLPPLTPVHIQMIRLTQAEREDWLSSGELFSDGQAESPDAPLSDDQSADIVRDLQSDRRLLYWLHILNRQPPDALSPEVIDAVVLLTTHSRPSVRTLAVRLTDRIPDEQLNPFRVKDNP